MQNAYAQKTVYQTTKHEAETTVSNTLKEKLDDYQKDMTGQLIGLISIFTALAFLVFGSISILDNLLTNVQNQPFFKVLFVADLWLLCMTNIFMIFCQSYREVYKDENRFFFILRNTKYCNGICRHCHAYDSLSGSNKQDFPRYQIKNDDT